MTEGAEQVRRPDGARFFSRWFWLWLAASVAYAIPVAYYADTSRPTQSEITRAWIYDALVLIAEYKGRKGLVVEVKSMVPLVPEDQQLKYIADYWDAEAAAYRATFRIAPNFLEPVEALNARYRARLAAGPAERLESQIESLRTWALPVGAGFLVVVLVYLHGRRNKVSGVSDNETDPPPSSDPSP
jgi:hypothetical protein